MRGIRREYQPCFRDIISSLLAIGISELCPRPMITKNKHAYRFQCGVSELNIVYMTIKNDWRERGRTNRSIAVIGELMTTGRRNVVIIKNLIFVYIRYYFLDNGDYCS
jgi:hypothetical protein